MVGIPVCDRPRRDTRYLVRVLPLCSGNDLGNPAAAGVQRQPALVALVNFAAPSVDRLDGREVVRAGAQPVRDQRATEVLQPFRVGSGDDGFA